VQVTFTAIVRMAANENHFYPGTLALSHLTLTGSGFVSHATQGKSKRYISLRRCIDSKMAADFEPPVISLVRGKEIGSPATAVIQESWFPHSGNPGHFCCPVHQLSHSSTIPISSSVNPGSCTSSFQRTQRSRKFGNQVRHQNHSLLAHDNALTYTIARVVSAVDVVLVYNAFAMHQQVTLLK